MSKMHQPDVRKMRPDYAVPCCGCRTDPESQRDGCTNKVAEDHGLKQAHDTERSIGHASADKESSG